MDHTRGRKYQPFNMSIRPADYSALIELNNRELHVAAVSAPNVSELENELLHRLETYISMFGDYLDPDEPQV